MKTMFSATIVLNYILFKGLSEHVDSENFRLYYGSDVHDFEDANTFCVNTLGTYLAQILSSQQNEEVRQLVNGRTTSAWIGFSDRYAPDSSEGNWRQMSDGHIDYTNWNSGEPNNANGNEDCAYISPDSGKWYDLDCSADLSFVCSKNKIILDTNYVYILGPHKSWNDAKSYCENNFGTRLAEIFTPDDQNEVLSLINTQGSGHVVWIGLTDSNEEGVFYWNTPENYGGYTNWNCGEPNNINGEHCTEINQDNNGLWNDNTCSQLKDFICDRS